MNIITDSKSLKEAVDFYSTRDAFVFDVETLGDHRGDPRRNIVAWIALSSDGRTDVIPMGHPNGEYVRTDYPLLPSAKLRVEKGLPLRPQDYSKDERKAVKVFTDAPEQLTPAEVFKELRRLFFSSALKVGHNVKFDIQSITKYLGALPKSPFACTLNAAFLLNNQHRHALGLDDCLKRELGYEMVKGVGKKIEDHSFDDVATYAGLDAEWTWKLWEHFQNNLKEDKLMKLFTLEMDVLEVICSMEIRGADVDVEALEILKEDLEAQIESAKASIYKTAGRAFNINSVPDKQRLLFTPKSGGGRGLKAKVLTPKGEKNKAAGNPPSISDFSVSEPALQALRGKDALVDQILEYQELNKLLTTYVVPYLGGEIVRTTSGKAKTLNKESLLYRGRVHTDFVQYGAETGRFSSRNPNLQNVPAPHTNNGRAIRNLFVAPEGHCLVVADYSQIEPRVIASFSKDRIMCKSYLDGSDIYTTVGSALGVDRKAGKVLVLSMAYGVGPDKIASQIGCSLPEAKTLLSDFLDKFPSVWRYKKQVVAESRRNAPIPFAQTLLKRRRYLPELRSSDPFLRSRAERQAFNTVIQGSAADLIKLAMVRAYSMIPEEAELILTVHDELVTVCPTNMAEETSEAIRESMEGIKALSIPMIADVRVVTRWGEAK